MTIQKAVKYLGITIINKFDFSQHIKVVEKKVACTTGILCKPKANLSKDVPYYCNFIMLSCIHT